MLGVKIFHHDQVDAWNLSAERASVENDISLISAELKIGSWVISHLGSWVILDRAIRVIREPWSFFILDRGSFWIVPSESFSEPCEERPPLHSRSAERARVDTDICLI